MIVSLRTSSDLRLHTADMGLDCGSSDALLSGFAHESSKLVLPAGGHGPDGAAQEVPLHLSLDYDLVPDVTVDLDGFILQGTMDRRKCNNGHIRAKDGTLMAWRPVPASFGAVKAGRSSARGGAMEVTIRKGPDEVIAIVETGESGHARSNRARVVSTSSRVAHAVDAPVQGAVYERGELSIPKCCNYTGTFTNGLASGKDGSFRGAQGQAFSGTWNDGRPTSGKFTQEAEVGTLEYDGALDEACKPHGDGISTLRFGGCELLALCEHGDVTPLSLTYTGGASETHFTYDFRRKQAQMAATGKVVDAADGMDGSAVSIAVVGAGAAAAGLAALAATAAPVTTAAALATLASATSGAVARGVAATTSAILGAGALVASSGATATTTTSATGLVAALTTAGWRGLGAAASTHVLSSMTVSSLDTMIACVAAESAVAGAGASAPGLWSWLSSSLVSWFWPMAALALATASVISLIHDAHKATKQLASFVTGVLRSFFDAIKTIPWRQIGQVVVGGVATIMRQLGMPERWSASVDGAFDEEEDAAVVGVDAEADEAVDNSDGEPDRVVAGAPKDPGTGAAREAAGAGCADVAPNAAGDSEPDPDETAQSGGAGVGYARARAHDAAVGEPDVHGAAPLALSPWVSTSGVYDDDEAKAADAPASAANDAVGAASSPAASRGGASGAGGDEIGATTSRVGADADSAADVRAAREALSMGISVSDVVLPLFKGVGAALPMSFLKPAAGFVAQVREKLRKADHMMNVCKAMTGGGGVVDVLEEKSRMLHQLCNEAAATARNHDHEQQIRNSEEALNGCISATRAAMELWVRSGSKKRAFKVANLQRLLSEQNSLYMAHIGGVAAAVDPRTIPLVLEQLLPGV